MTDKVTLTNISTFVNDSSAATTYNNNLAAITSGFDNTLSLNGLAPNQMQANLDMNSNRIINLPAPGSVSEPARLQDVVTNPTITVPPTGTAGAVVPYLNTSCTWTTGTTQTFSNVAFNGNTTHTGTDVFNGAATFNSTAAFNGATTFGNTVTLPSNTITSANIQNNAVTNADIRQSAALSVIGNSTNATANVADITGTANQVLQVNSGGTALSFGAVNLAGSSVTGILPAANGGGMVLLGTTSASNQAVLADTTSLVTGSYSIYEIVFENIVPITNSTTLIFQIQTGGAFPGANYFGTTLATYTATSIINTTASLQVSGGTGVTNSSANGGVCGYLRIHNPQSTTIYKQMYGNFSHYNGTVCQMGNFGGSYQGATTAVTGFQFLFNSGNVSTGTVKVYGIL